MDEPNNRFQSNHVHHIPAKMNALFFVPPKTDPPLRSKGKGQIEGECEGEQLTMHAEPGWRYSDR